MYPSKWSKTVTNEHRKRKRARKSEKNAHKHNDRRRRENKAPKLYVLHTTKLLEGIGGNFMSFQHIEMVLCIYAAQTCNSNTRFNRLLKTIKMFRILVSFNEKRTEKSE